MKPLNPHDFTDKPHRQQHGSARALAEGPVDAALLRVAVDVEGPQLAGILVTHRRPAIFGSLSFPTARPD